MPSLKNYVIDGHAFGGSTLVRDSFKLGGVWRCYHPKGQYENEMDGKK